MLSKKAKIATIGILASTTLCVFAAGTLATLTASTESQFIAAAGTVQIELSDVQLSNAKSVVPGDNDPSVPKGNSKGTSHELSYMIYNVGTKSIQTRQTIILTATKENSKKTLLDASFLKLYDGKKELEDKTYILSSGKEVTKLKDGQKAIAVKYTFFGDSFDGSENAYVKLKEDKDSGEEYYIIEKETGDESFIVADESGDVGQSYKFDFCLSQNAPNSFQNCEITAYVNVEALQYRNSLEEDWEDAATVTRGFSSNRKLTIDSLPSFVEDSEGTEIDKNSEELDEYLS